MTKNLTPLRSLAGFRAGALASVALAASACTTNVDSPRAGGSRLPPGAVASGSGGASVTASGGAPGAQATGAAPGAGGNPQGSGGTALVIPVTPTEGPARGVLRLLTNEEYRNTIRSLLKLPSVPSDDLQPETVSESYRNFSDVLIVTGTLGGQYASLAARVAGEVTDFQTLAPCAQGAAPRDCASAFVRSFGKLAYRRPLTDAEVETHLGLFDGELARSSYQEGIRLVLEAMLQAPNLLYRFELGTPTPGGTTRTLDSFESASLLSYMLTSNPPDAELLATADANQLTSPAAREAQARRLLTTEQAKTSIRSFMRQWSQIDVIGPLQKDQTAYPTYSAELWASMLAETNKFFDSVMWQGDATFKTLMTSGNSFADGALSSLYGSDNQSAQGTLVPIVLNPAQRSGLLTQASVLASHSKLNESFPIARGKLVRKRFLCQDLPPPPPAIAKNVVPIPVDPTSTGRERFEAHSTNPTCSGCHALIDPVGFGLENYDGIGQWRTLDNNKPINSAGNLTATRDIDGPFTGVELSQKLSTSTEAQDCFSLQAMRWAFGRDTFKSTTDRQVASAITTQVGAGLNMQEALIALIKSDSFVVRSAQ